MKRLALLSWSLVALAFFAWAGVGLLAWTISGEVNDRAQSVDTAQASSDEQALTTREHALAQSSASDRTALSNILNVDIVSAVDTIQSAGTAAGVDVKLSSASPEGAPAASSDQLPLQAVDFSVDTDGSFSSLMHAAELFETLPIPSSVQLLNFSESSDQSGKPSWHLEASIHVLTTAPISS